jgi:hypothetical protein
MLRPLIAIGLTSALLFSGCDGTGAAPSATAPVTQKITGTVRIGWDGVYTCVVGPVFGWGGFADIPGASVTVKDGTGTIIGVSKLELPIEDGYSYCLFPFSVTVSDSEFYSIEVSNRGEVTYSRAELESQGWSLKFKLGP